LTLICTDKAGFNTGSIFSFHNTPHVSKEKSSQFSAVQSRHQQQFSTNVLANTGGDYLAELHVLPYRLTGNKY
jgi:hypothetical protein